jgi:hypothetical protein
MIRSPLRIHMITTLQGSIKGRDFISRNDHMTNDRASIDSRHDEKGNEKDGIIDC